MDSFDRRATVSGLSYTRFSRFGAPADLPTVVLCHGIGMQAAGWTSWHGSLIDRYRVVAVDVRGYGRSAVAGSLVRSLDGWADDLVEVLDAEGLSGAYFVGESMGGTAVLHLAATAPERVLACAVLSTGYRGALISEASKWPEIFNNGGLQGWSEYMLDCRFESSVAPSVRLAVHDIQMQCSPDIVLQDCEVIVRCDLTEEVRSIRIPVLVINGGESPFIPMSHAAELAEALDDGSLIIFRGSRHGIPYSRAFECARASARFFDSVELAGAGPPRGGR